MPSPKPHVSIIIVTYGQRAMTERCLRSLQRCLGERLGREWELVLIDNNSPDDTPALLGSWSDRAVVRLLDENRNFAGGCNTGAQAASGEVLIFLNNDTEVTPGALELLAEQALEPGVAMAGARLLFPDGTLQHAGVVFVRVSRLGNMPMPTHVFYGQDADLPQAQAIYELDAVTGACMAVRADAFRAVGGFDEGYVNELEDIDLCLRVRLGGDRVVYRGDATVIHFEGRSRGRGEELVATPERAERLRANMLRFLDRWSGSLDQDDEVALALWDASLRESTVTRLATEADVVVAGAPSSLGPAAEEARALLGALASASLLPAAVERPIGVTTPRLSTPLASALEAARWRRASGSIPWVHVPSGSNSPARMLGSPSIVRVASARSGIDLARADHIWASSPAVADALCASGLQRSKVALLAPPVLPVPFGPGGEGVLALLPAHDAALSRSLLAELGRLSAAIPLRLMPTVAARGLSRSVAESLPQAELLAPCADDARFAALAGRADVLVAIDPHDPFERRALVAAGVGTMPLTGNPDGPAAWVLGGSGVIADRLGLARALQGALERAGERASLADAVAQRCGPGAAVALLERCSIAQPAAA